MAKKQTFVEQLEEYLTATDSLESLDTRQTKAILLVAEKVHKSKAFTDEERPVLKRTVKSFAAPTADIEALIEDAVSKAFAAMEAQRTENQKESLV